jgi:hypothetical protein
MTDDYQIICVHDNLMTIKVSPVVPPFLYSNLCGSVILTSYIPVYIYMYILSVVITVASTYTYCKYVNYTTLSTVIQKTFMGLMWPKHDWNGDAESLSRLLLKADNIVCNVLHHICILLTFGMCCPALAVAIAIFVSCKVWIFQIVLGRFLETINHSEEVNNISIATKSFDYPNNVWLALELAASDIDVYVSNCMWEVVCMSSVFFALLCWDMASDTSLLKDAVWLPITAITIPLTMWLCYTVIKMHYFIDTNNRFESANFSSTKSLASFINKRNSRINSESNRALEHNDVELRESKYSATNTTSKSYQYNTDTVISPFSSHDTSI